MKKKILSLVLTAAMIFSIPSFMLTVSAVDNWHPSKDKCCGDINQDAVIDIKDALESLKYLARMSCVMADKGRKTNTEVQQQKLDTANFITNRALDANGKPTLVNANHGIADSLELLKKLAKMKNKIDDCQCKPCDCCGMYTGQFPSCKCAPCPTASCGGCNGGTTNCPTHIPTCGNIIDPDCVHEYNATADCMKCIKCQKDIQQRTAACQANPCTRHYVAPHTHTYNNVNCMVCTTAGCTYQRDRDCSTSSPCTFHTIHVHSGEMIINCMTCLTCQEMYRDRQCSAADPCQLHKLPPGHTHAANMQVNCTLCTDCGLVFQNRACSETTPCSIHIVLPVHQFADCIPGAAATCTSAQVCTVTGSGCPWPNNVIAPMLGHSPGAPATCQAAQTCQRAGCGYEIAPMLAHVWVYNGAGANQGTHKCTAGCGVSAEACDPKTPGATCAKCKNVAVDTSPCDANGHTPGPVKTCTEDQKCTVCNATIDQALGHPGYTYNGTDSGTHKCTATGCTLTAEGCSPRTTAGDVCTKCSNVYIISTCTTHVPGPEATCTAPQICTNTDCGLPLNPALDHLRRVSPNATTETNCTQCTRAGCDANKAPLNMTDGGLIRTCLTGSECDFHKPHEHIPNLPINCTVCTVPSCAFHGSLTSETPNPNGLPRAATCIGTGAQACNAHKVNDCNHVKPTAPFAGVASCLRCTLCNVAVSGWTQICSGTDLCEQHGDPEGRVRPLGRDNRAHYPTIPKISGGGDPGKTNPVITATCANPIGNATMTGPCTKSGPVCHSCGYCRDCEWKFFGVVHCTSCNWGSDCLAALRGRADEDGQMTIRWCHEAGICASCCAAGAPQNGTPTAGHKCADASDAGFNHENGGTPTFALRTGVCGFGCPRDQLVCLADCKHHPVDSCARCAWRGYGIITCRGCSRTTDCLSANGATGWNNTANRCRYCAP